MTSLTPALQNCTINVPFHGSELYVIEHNGEPYTPMRPIIDGMGMDWASQFTKLKQRFKTYVVKITMQLPGDDQRRDVICLALRKLAAWLNTISPNKVRPEIRERVIRYQEECDDVLYEYWTKGQVTNPRSMEPAIDMMNIDLHLRIRDGQVESIERIGSDMFVGKVEQILSGLRKSGWIVIKRDLLAEKLATW
ncbi:phage antirepressor N-terminal domain-containing protein [Citrobacter sp. Cpo113]|uniref:phage antirepressor N-terminal domain-containing protein n=1 Tax=Citrobacter sp. Cpo113 TaxID=2985146 RepID=UPI0025753B1C|nr:phage antirepressor N-terminal domain-containing protein [Citrobacter sp. Cpo113]MDM2789214.1 phage antirepressor N-terminal domain-containing protein [Citrobacter sp. Cpo113]